MGSFFSQGLFTQKGKQEGIDELREELHADVARLDGDIAENSSDIAANTASIESLTDDLNTNYYTKTEVDGKISAVYKYKGSVATYNDLPTNLTEQETGYVYNVETADAEHHVNANDNLAWNGTAWDNLGGFVDFSKLATKTELQEGVSAAEAFATAADAIILQDAKDFATAAVDAEAQVRLAVDATKVDKEITGTNGKAIIFNESDGGGSQFLHNDGTESYVGVHDGGQNGLVAQIYADRLVGGKWTGAKLDVKNDGMYYTVGNKSFAERAIPENEVAVKHDVTDAVASEAAARSAADATKVDKELTSASGKALIFNETDGGGAKFEHADGTWSFTGVNDGGENGIAGQIYVLKKDNENKFNGTRIDLTKGGMYYTKGNQAANERLVEANELATKGNIAAAVATLESRIAALEAAVAYVGEEIGE